MNASIATNSLTDIAITIPNVLDTRSIPITWARAPKLESYFTHYRSTWSFIVDKLTLPENVRRLPVNSADYAALEKDERSSHKNGECWWGVELNADEPMSRKVVNIKNHSILALDIDKTELDFPTVEKIIHDKLGVCEYVVHLSASSTPENVSCRLVIPLARRINSVAYEALARNVVKRLQPGFGDALDWTSVQANRLMYFPTLPSDAKHEFVHNQPTDARVPITELSFDRLNEHNTRLLEQVPVSSEPMAWLDPLAVLSPVSEWWVRTNWPAGKHENADAVGRGTGDRRDPRDVEGVYGAVCRTYGVEVVLEMTGKWTASSDEDRWGYTDSTSGNGGRVHDGGLFFYSYHHHDPYNNRLLNAYEIVLAHKFGGLTGDPDKDAKAITEAEKFWAEDAVVMAEAKRFDDKQNGFIASGFAYREKPLDVTLDRVSGPADPVSNYPETLTQMLERYVFFEHGGGGLRVFDTAKMTVRALPAGIHDLHVRTEEGPLGGIKTIKCLDEWKAHPQRMTTSDVVWDPTRQVSYENEHGHLCCNTYRAEVHEKIDAITEDVQIVIDHIDWLFPVERDRVWFWQWMGHVVQRVGVRIPVSPLLLATGQGVGRGAIISIMNLVLGSHYVTSPRIGDVINKEFNGFLFDCLLTVIDEVHSKGFEAVSVSDKMKTMISESSLHFEAKNVEAYKRQCFTNILMLSNRPDALRLDDQDRRVQVLTNPDEARYLKDGREKHDRYYDRLYLAIDGRSRDDLETPETEERQRLTVAGFYTHLMNISLSGFERSRAWADSDAKANMLSMSRSSTEEALNDLCANPPALAMTSKQIHARCSDSVIAEGDERSMHEPINKNEMKKLFSGGLYVKMYREKNPRGDRFRLNGESVRLYYFVGRGSLSFDMARVLAVKYEKNKNSGAAAGFSHKPAEIT